MIDSQPLTIVVDGQEVSLGLASSEPLVRAVIISLFTWRRARPDDEQPGNSREGWWGDTFASVQDDRIGSRLWLLSRAKMTAETPRRAKEYAEEALAWLVEDGIAARVDVEVERRGIDTLALATRIYKADGSVLSDVRFTDFWSFLQ